MSILEELLYLSFAFALCMSLYFNLMQAQLLRRVKSQSTVARGTQHRQASFGTHKIHKMVDQLEVAMKGLATSNYWTQNHQKCHSLYKVKLRNEFGQIRGLLNELKQLRYDADSFVAEQPSSVLCAQLDLTSVWEALTNFASFHGVELRIDFDEQCVVALPNSVLGKLIKEIVVNAIVHNHESTVVRVDGGVYGSNLIINVRDNGVGIPKEVVSKVWDTASDSKATQRRRTDENFYLDLPTVITTLQAFKGKVEINSSVRHGTHIRLYVPIQELENCAELLTDSEKTQELGTSYLKVNNASLVLFVNFSGGRLCQELVEANLSHYNISTVNSGDQALVEIANRNVQLLVLDTDIEYEQAMQLSSIVRASRKTRDIPIVLLTFAIPQDIRLEFLRKGMTNILEKPVQKEEVSAMLKACLSRLKHTSAVVEEALATYTIRTSEIDFSNTSDDFAKNFESIVEDHYADSDFSRGNCASMLCMSEQTLHRRIRENFDTNFRSYVQEFRMQKAREMLLNGESVTNTSLNVGINSLSNFTRNFRATFGYPPSKLSKRTIR
ncbi:helix-turn-helix domain-containing protein [Agaribacter flavus]|uniref:Helix-turn-helix domain-containing protein n=1 Tax=Agaribacter flavus TaxID=1902781 RepID=A0ABV7FRP3_9ALTE